MKQHLYNTLFLDWAIPLMLLAVIAPFTPYLDIYFSNYFYNSETKQFSQNGFFYFMFNYGLLPQQIAGIIALIIFLLSFPMKSLKKWRQPALSFGLTIALGAGLITHAVLKDHWGRPRPKQIEQFGGNEQHRHFYQPDFQIKSHSKSFPSGHCAMAYCFFSLAVQGRRLGNRRLFFLGLFLAFSFGFLLSITRIAQGGHFFSDTLVAGCLMWITAATCDWWLDRREKEIKTIPSL